MVAATVAPTLLLAEEEDTYLDESSAATHTDDDAAYPAAFDDVDAQALPMDEAAAFSAETNLGVPSSNSYDPDARDVNAVAASIDDLEDAHFFGSSSDGTSSNDRFVQQTLSL